MQKLYNTDVRSGSHVASQGLSWCPPSRPVRARHPYGRGPVWIVRIRRGRGRKDTPSRLRRFRGYDVFLRKASRRDAPHTRPPFLRTARFRPLKASRLRRLRRFREPQFHHAAGRRGAVPPANSARRSLGRLRGRLTSTPRTGSRGRGPSLVPPCGRRAPRNPGTRGTGCAAAARPWPTRRVRVWSRADLRLC